MTNTTKTLRDQVIASVRWCAKCESSHPMRNYECPQCRGKLVTLWLVKPDNS